MTEHPAKFSRQLLPTLGASLIGCKRVLDPFAGTGRIHDLNGMTVLTNSTVNLDGVNTHKPQRPITLDLETYGIELEPEWATMDARTQVGDALHVPYPDGYFDAICTSPTYGNRMADSHTPSPEDTSKRHTYTHTLGRKLHPNNSGQLQWGPEYKAFHNEWLIEANRNLRPGGRLVINIKNHIRKGQIQRVTEWFQIAAREVGFLDGGHTKIETPGQRHGQNGDLRVDYESVLIFFKPLNIGDAVVQEIKDEWLDGLS